MHNERWLSQLLCLFAAVSIGCSGATDVNVMDGDNNGGNGDVGGGGGGGGGGGDDAGGGGSGPDGSTPDPDVPQPPVDRCEGEAPVSTPALAFDGDTRVEMGNVSNLGLERFTIETWVRRTGKGTHSSTGVGGLRLIPMVSKGRGESDGSNVDCNYMFGFHGDVLGADFEDMASGANHPVFGRTPIPYNEWHHVAVSYDGTTWRLYLNGALDGERTVNATPRYDSIQHFGLGAGWNSTGVHTGGLVGDLAEVRVYSRALEPDEIRATMSSSTPELRGLVAHYPLNDTDETVRDQVGAANGNLIGGTFHNDGPVIDRGTRPTIDAARVEGGDLVIEASDVDGDELEVDFYVRQITDDDDFTIVVMPDSQYYTRNAGGSRPNADNPEYFHAQTRWAMEHIESDNVVGLIHVGDIINNADQNAQWARADAGIAILDQPTDRFPHGLPYGLSFGNHDQFPGGQAGATTRANEIFGLGRIGDRPWFGGSYSSSKVDESWVSFWVGELQVIVLSMQFNTSPDPRVLEWARGVFESHPHALGVINSHFILTGGGEFSPQGQAIYDAVKDVPNVWLMTSGHVSKDATRTNNHNGNIIHAMLSDYQRSAPSPEDPEKPVVVAQSQTNGGQGYMRIWRISPREQKLYVRTYSPFRDASYTDPRNQFTLDLDVTRAGGAFTKVDTVPVSGGRAQVPHAAGADDVVEWYAVARDCLHEVRTDITRVQ